MVIIQIQDDAADIHGVSQQSVARICHRVAVALARRSREYIQMPATPAEQHEVVSSFRNICGFRNVVGAIDCTHIKIRKVPGEASQYYVNRKGYYSLNVQIVCDASLRIRDIVAHWRGSTHDSRIFRESRIKQRLEAGEFRGRLLGDSGYACTPYLFTPVLNPNTQKEENYNRAHIRTRNVVERCFGVWKQRFRCLLKGFNNNLEHTKTCIVALAVLHNIAVDMGEVLEDDIAPLPEADQLPVMAADNWHLRGQAVRQTFINTYF